MNQPAHAKSPRIELNKKFPVSLFFLAPVVKVKARYKNPNATPKAAKMDKSANSTGTPSGQYPPWPLAAPAKSSNLRASENPDNKSWPIISCVLWFSQDNLVINVNISIKDKVTPDLTPHPTTAIDHTR